MALIGVRGLWTAGIFAAALAAPAFAQTTLELRVPADTPAASTVYVAGSFNGWDPAAAGWALKRRDDGIYALTLPEDVRGSVEFKFTLGGWETGEQTADGAGAPNRTATLPAGGAFTWTGEVARWGSGVAAAKPHTASAQVSVLAEAFAMPQLGRTRRVWIYLPPDYATSRKRYPVIYMHDGQNVFDDATSGFGEWGVDETLDGLFAKGDPGAIVVAVDHGGEHRLDEYDPWPNAVDPKYGGGEGGAYVAFLVDTLKPYVDAHYRTRRDPAHTAVMGSSMGGLISLYAALERPDVFGRAGVFSSATWLVRDHVLALAATPRAKRYDQRIWFVSGGAETNTSSPFSVGEDQAATVAALARAGFAPASLNASVPADGQHSEWFWRREFPAAYRWLFAR
ncbi:alpha/beta hydrolase-fold protein [Caulobacter sp. 17J65-9]|uniref:alpha/beta hydrolase n=1 Tax=Caulobacter sp. 17J65-9 TaxID=2709382 RepID=UPI0013C58578|nr:alpha/beta hydrolase-fold protein [Caulobacter sp. 17J65-9]NEX91749.1 alpha/beta hydrolase [Caulobacter sp. 17J65-9]